MSSKVKTSERFLAIDNPEKQMDEFPETHSQQNLEPHDYSPIKRSNVYNFNLLEQ